MSLAYIICLLFVLIRGNELRFSDLLRKLTNTLEENISSAAPISYMRGEIQSNRERNIKKGHTFAFSKSFKSIQERYFALD